MLLQVKFIIYLHTQLMTSFVFMLDSKINVECDPYCSQARQILKISLPEVTNR